MKFLARTAGDLRLVESLGVKLPAGRLITAAEDETDDPVLWVAEKSGASHGKLWTALSEQFARTGLWPLVLSSLSSEDSRPWLDGELDPSMSTSATKFDAKKVLAKQWKQVIPVEDEDPEAFEPLEPFGAKFPGLAAATAGKELDLARAVNGLTGRLGLLPVKRPADVPCAVGWMGPLNHFSDMGQLSAVLRSWEDRFGAALVELGFDTVTVAVARPVTSAKHAQAIAAELFAICPDSVHQGAGSIAALAEELVDAPTWQLWWD